MRSIAASLTRKDGVKEEPGSKPPIRVDVRVVGKTLTKATAVEASDALSPTLTSSGKSNKDLSRQSWTVFDCTYMGAAKLFWSQIPVRD